MSPKPRPQVAAITGASAGVGRATARLFARSGARIGLGLIAAYAATRGRVSREGAEAQSPMKARSA